jgi:translation initiation factor IF-3
VRLIDGSGALVGIIPTDEALGMAREAGLDLVEVSPNERPPVCKIMDYGKHKYLQSKKQKQQHHERRTKEIRLRPKTDPHDREIKIKHARGFLEGGNRVQFTMMFRGRERFHAETGYESFREISNELVDLARVEQPAKLQGRRLTMLLVPVKLGRPTKPKPAPESKTQPVTMRPHEPAEPAAEVHEPEDAVTPSADP